MSSLISWCFNGDPGTDQAPSQLPTQPGVLWNRKSVESHSSRIRARDLEKELQGWDPSVWVRDNRELVQTSLRESGRELTTDIELSN